MFKKKFTVNVSSARKVRPQSSSEKIDGNKDLSVVEQTPPPQESGPVLGTEPIVVAPQPSPAADDELSMVDDGSLPIIDSTEATCTGMEFPDLVDPEGYETGRSFMQGEQLKWTKARRDLLPRLEQIAEKFMIRDVYLKNKINQLFSKLPSCKSLEESAMAAFYVCARVDRRTTGHQPITLQQVAVNSNLTIPGIGAIVSKIVDPASKLLPPEDLQAYYGQEDFSGGPLPPFEVEVKGVSNCVRDVRKLTEKIVTKVSAVSSHYLDRNSTKMAAAFIAYKSICYYQKAAPISRQKFFETFKLEGTGINFPSVTNMDKQIREDLLLLAQGMSGAKKTGKFLALNLTKILDNGNDSADDGPSTPLPVYSSYERPIRLQTQMKGLNQEEIALLMTQGIGESNEDEMKMYLIEDGELAQFKEDKMREKKRRTKIDAPAFSDAGQSDEDSMSD